jgi:hypothetical protein
MDSNPDHNFDAGLRVLSTFSEAPADDRWQLYELMKRWARERALNNVDLEKMRGQILKALDL